jgi:Cu/Ag efflux pump CusA
VPRPLPRQKPSAERRRALKLLAKSARGATEAILAAHGITVETLVDMVHAELATAKIERMVAGSKPMDVTVVRITDAGRRALEDWST